MFYLFLVILKLAMEFNKYQIGDMRRLGIVLDETKIDFDTTWTLWDKDLVIACGGFKELFTKVWELWLHTRNFDITQHNILRFIHKFKQEIKTLDWVRIQITIGLGTKGDELPLILGFVYEGMMHKWGPDHNNYSLYSMVR